MSITVERRKVARLARMRVADGPRLVVEGLECHASCGCLYIFGMRLDNDETTCVYAPCARHEPRSAELLARIIAPEGRGVETSEWIATCLDALDLAPDPYYSCGAAYCDDPACATHNPRHPHHAD